MNILKHFDRRLRVFRFKIDDLSPDHSIDGPSGFGNFRYDFDASLGGALQSRQHLVRLRLQGVPRQDGDSFPKRFVTSWAPAPQIIVIEGGKIVMNQRVFVHNDTATTE